MISEFSAELVFYKRWMDFSDCLIFFNFSLKKTQKNEKRNKRSKMIKNKKGKKFEGFENGNIKVVN